ERQHLQRLGAAPPLRHSHAAVVVEGRLALRRQRRRPALPHRLDDRPRPLGADPDRARGGPGLNDQRGGDGGGALGAVGDAGAAQPVAGEAQAGERGLELGGEGDEALVAELVLRDGARPAANERERWIAACAEGALEVLARDAQQLGVVALDELGRAAAAEEASEEDVAGWRAAGEEARAEEAAEEAQPRSRRG